MASSSKFCFHEQHRATFFFGSTHGSPAPGVKHVPVSWDNSQSAGMTASYPEAVLLFLFSWKHGVTFCMSCFMSSLITWSALGFASLVSSGVFKERCCCPFVLCPTAALTPKGEMLFSEGFWGGSVTRWVFLGHIGILHAKAGFPATCVVDTCMPPVSQPETPCRSFPCVMTSGQCLLTISHMFPTGCSSTPILTT